LEREEVHVPRNAPTIYEVARRAGVSIATVSRVQRGSPAVSEETRRRVLQAIEEVGYRPSHVARSLAEGRRNAVAVVFPNLSGPYYSEVILGFEQEVVAAGQSVLILSTHGRPASHLVVDELAGKVDGMLLFSRTVSDDVVRRLHDAGLPLVLLARPAVAGVDTVKSENRAAAARLTAHLHGHGYRRILFLGDAASSPDTGERWSGFVDAHRRARLSDPPQPVPCSFREAEGYAAAAAILDREDRPEALFCANDEIALGAYAAAQERGLRIPADLAVTGWDDIPMARYLSPPLTTVHQPMRSLGARAAQLLLERIAGRRTDAITVVLPTRLVLRASCGCPSGGAVQEA
jgi:LacI family transcriptional regulator